MNKSDRLLKNTIIIGIGVLCTKMISFLMIPLYTAWLSPAQYGDYDLLVSYMTLFVPIITLELEQAVFRFSLKEKDDAKIFFGTAAIVTIVNMVLADIIAIIILNGSECRFAFIAYFNAYSLYVVIFEYLRGIKKLKDYSLYNIIISILIVGLNFLFVPYLKMNVSGLIYSFAGAYLIVDIIVIIREKLLFSKTNKSVDKNILKKMLSYSLPMIPNGISWWITNVSDRTIIKYSIGEYYNGLYAISCKIPTIISLLFSVFNLSWQQSAIENYDDKDRNAFYLKTFNYLIPLLFYGGMLIITMLPFAFKYFINANYNDAIINVPILVLAAIFLCFAQFFNGLLLAKKETKKIGLSTTIAAVLNVIINILFMKKYGVIVAGISTLISYAFLFIYRYALFIKVFKTSTLLKILLYSICLSIVSFITVYTNNLLISLILTLIIAMLFSIGNKKLIVIIAKKAIGRISKKKGAKSND